MSPITPDRDNPHLGRVVGGGEALSVLLLLLLAGVHLISAIEYSLKI